MKCYYRSSSLDSTCSAALIKALYAECDLVPIENENVESLNLLWPDLGETVYIVGFAFPMSIMFAINYIANLIWIDHVIQDIDEALKVCFLANCGQSCNTDKASCEQIVEWFTGAEYTLPKSVYLISQFTVPLERNEEAFDFAAGMGEYNKEVYDPATNFWPTLWQNDKLVEDIILKGRRIRMKKKA